MPALLTTILAVAKAVPVIDQWLQKLIVAYANSRIDAMAKADRDSIKTALNQQDQRDLEKALGSLKAGEASNINGTVIVTTLPGVK